MVNLKKLTTKYLHHQKVMIRSENGVEQERKKQSPLKVGDKVTGVEGRASHGWHGEIKKIDKLPDGRLYYRVYWKERANHENKVVAKNPILGMTQDQICRSL